MNQKVYSETDAFNCPCGQSHSLKGTGLPFGKSADKHLDCCSASMKSLYVKYNDYDKRPHHIIGFHDEKESQRLEEQFKAAEQHLKTIEQGE